MSVLTSDPRSPGERADTASWAAGTVQRVRGAVDAWLATSTRLDLVLLLTLVLVLIEPPPTRLAGLVDLVVVAGLVVRPLARLPLFWFSLVAVWAVTSLPVHWASADNHKWLLVYWTLAVGIALTTSRPLEHLAVTARLLIGLVFLFATAWKLMSPDFPSGAFFHFTLLTDIRFSDIAEVFGGLPEGSTAANAAAIDAWDDPTVPPAALELADGPRVAAVGLVMAVGTIVVEGLVALAFLVPERWRLSRLRELALCLFVLATYPLAPVVGFGWVLVTMALASSRLRRPVGELLYVSAFLAIFAFQGLDVVWRALRAVLPGV